MPTTARTRSRRRPRGLALLATLLVLPAALTAQQGAPPDSLAFDSVVAGTRVRLSTEEAPRLRTGAVTRHWSDTLLVELQPSRELIRVSRDQLRALDVPNGRTRSGRRILAGLVIGAAAGWVLGNELDAARQQPAAGCGSGQPACPRKANTFGLGIAVGTLAGVALGARRVAIRWEPVALR